MLRFILFLSFVVVIVGCERKQTSQIIMKKREDFILKCVSSARYDKNSVEGCRMTAWRLYDE